ncbi:hypothetical protein [Novosphingobium sp.]|uniref:baeRF11 domain-containing protein n=1 Tax=Novosphingobium sp. TaxID=1874826 RepID=UPI0027348630|nr:hypothetical protein [Novosphingobium sp.]MDP3908466.1 hypothetical protein [Novosphingobium sp.]
MLHVDVPSLSELRTLIAVRADAAVSIYLPTTPHGQHSDASRILLGNLLKDALAQLDAEEFDKRRRATLEEHVQALREDDDFWQMQAHSLAILATPDTVRTFRLATSVHELAAVSDRYHLTPLLRAVAFSQHAYVLALSENAVRLIEIFADAPPVVIKVAGLPTSAAAAAGKASINNLTQNTRIANAEGQTFLLRAFARKVDAALRPVLSGRDTPLILAAADPLAAIFRGLASAPGLIAEGISASPDRLTDAELAEVSRPILDAHYAADIAAALDLHAQRAGEGRATTDLAHAARAAAQGAIELLLVDIDANQPGTMDDDGNITVADAGAASYDLIDELAGRALATGARVMGVRGTDLPAGAALAAVLRYKL